MRAACALPLGTNSIARKPISGRKRTTSRRFIARPPRKAIARITAIEPGHHPRRVTPYVPGLSEFQNSADGSRDLADAVDRAVDQPDIRGSPQQRARAVDRGMDHGRIVEFVDEILVVNQRVERPEARSQSVRNGRRHNVEQVRQSDPTETESHRDVHRPFAPALSGQRETSAPGISGC